MKRREGREVCGREAEGDNGMGIRLGRLWRRGKRRMVTLEAGQGCRKRL